MIRDHYMYKTMTRSICVASVLLCSAAVSAATTPESGDKIDLKYDALASENVVKPIHTGTCPLYIAPSLDARQNKETIGASMSGAALLVEDVRPWMNDGLGHLKNYGYPVSEITDGASPAADGVTLRASVTRAYIWQIGIKIFSMVAVKAEFLDRNGVLQQKYYRAHGDKTNMWGANSEYVTTLNYGLNNMLPFIARDLQSLCKGEKVEDYTYAGPNGVPQ